jgi:NitT/TauT family transport system substrate-binding protein
MALTPTRRHFMTTMSLASAAGVMNVPPLRAAEGALETTAVRLAKTPDTCAAPQHVAEQLLRAEGFTDVRYVEVQPPIARWIGGGEVDFSNAFASVLLTAIDAGAPITILAGLHSGCIEVFGNETVRSFAELKGKSVGVPDIGSSPHVLLSIMAAQVGLDPANDIRWISGPNVEPMQLFVDGKVDAFVGAPPWSLDLRELRIGHVILATAVDRPWSQYFCCMLGGSSDYVRKQPIASKAVLRAILKATDLCVNEPAVVARRLVEGGFASRRDWVLQMLSENAYDKWREYDAEDTVRFYALRDAGFIHSSPQKIIAENIDWRFLNELKRELKA